MSYFLNVSKYQYCNFVNQKQGDYGIKKKGGR